LQIEKYRREKVSVTVTVTLAAPHWNLELG